MCEPWAVGDSEEPQAFPKPGNCSQTTALSGRNPPMRTQTSQGMARGRDWDRSTHTDLRAHIAACLEPDQLPFCPVNATPLCRQGAAFAEPELQRRACSYRVRRVSLLQHAGREHGCTEPAALQHWEAAQWGAPIGREREQPSSAQKNFYGVCGAVLGGTTRH